MEIKISFSVFYDDCTGKDKKELIKEIDNYLKNDFIPPQTESVWWRTMGDYQIEEVKK